jgi:hypothetical protein
MTFFFLPLPLLLLLLLLLPLLPPRLPLLLLPRARLWCARGATC